MKNLHTYAWGHVHVDGLLFSKPFLNDDGLVAVEVEFKNQTTEIFYNKTIKQFIDNDLIDELGCELTAKQVKHISNLGADVTTFFNNIYKTVKIKQLQFSNETDRDEWISFLIDFSNVMYEIVVKDGCIYDGVTGNEINYLDHNQMALIFKNNDLDYEVCRKLARYEGYNTRVSDYLDFITDVDVNGCLVNITLSNGLILQEKLNDDGELVSCDEDCLINYKALEKIDGLNELWPIEQHYVFNEALKKF